MLFSTSRWLSPLKWYYISFIILTFATLLTDSYIEKYTASGTNILALEYTETNTDNGALKISNNFEPVTTLTSDNTHSYTNHLYVTKINIEEKFIHFETEIQSNQIIHGNLYWEAGRTVVYFLDSNKKVIKGTQHTVKHIYTDKSWINLNHTYLIPIGAAYVKAGIEFLNTSGSIEIKNTKVKYAEETKLHHLTRFLLLLFWLVTITLFFKAITKNTNILKKYAFISVITLTVVGIILPQNIKLMVANFLRINHGHHYHNVSNHFILKTIVAPMEYIHLFAFTAITIISLLTFSHLYRNSYIIFNLFILSIISEVLQVLALERSPKTGDLIIDSYGVLLGLIIFALYKHIFSKT